MGNVKLSPQLLGTVGQKIARICDEEEVSIEDAYTIFCDQVSATWSKYDLTGQKSDILASAEAKLPKSKKEAIIKSKPTPDNKMAVVIDTNKPKGKVQLAKPLAIRVKGEVDLIKDGNGYAVKRTEKTKKVSLFCPDVNMNCWNDIVRSLVKSTKRLFEDKRFEYIWNKLFFNGIEKNPDSIFYNNYENKIWRERHLSEVATTFGQKLNKVATFSLKRVISNTNEVFPHLFEFIIYELIDPRDVDVPQFFISVTEYYDVCKALLCESEKLVYNGNILKLIKDLNKELNRSPDEPLFVVWYGFDPRIMGDNYSEAYEQIAYLGYEDEAMEFRRRSRSNKHRCAYYSYPEKIGENEIVEIGQKRIIHHARNPPTNQYDREIEQREYDNGY